MEFSAARRLALRLLSLRSYHSTQLREKLTKKGVSAPICDQVIEECQRLGYLQDEEWETRAILRELERGHGPRYIEAKLRLSRQKVRSLITPERQKERIARLIPKLGPYPKAIRALERRGFDRNVIIELLKFSKTSD